MKSLTLVASVAAVLILAVPSASASPVNHSVRKTVTVPMPPVKPLILADNVDASRVAQDEAKGANASIKVTGTNISDSAGPQDCAASHSAGHNAVGFMRFKRRRG